MKFLSWVGNKLKLVSTADFIDFGSGPFRVRVAAPPLTADRTGTIALAEDLRKRATTGFYYVSTTGNDVTGDGIANPFATIQRAIDEISALDGNGLTATIALSAGTYAGAALPATLVGWSRLSITTAAVNTVFITSPINLTGKTPVTLRSLNFTPATPATSLASVIAVGVDVTIRQCAFGGGDAAYVHISVTDSIVRTLASTVVSGAFAALVRGSGNTIYHSGSLSASAAATFATFFDVADGEIVQGATAPTAPTGTFTGTKYNAAFIGIADALIPGVGGVRTHQPASDNLSAIAPLTTNGVYRRTGANTADILPVGATGAASMAAGNQAAGRGAIAAEARSDNYIKGNYSIKTGGANTNERWVFIPVEYDVYNRIVISRGYNDDSSGYATLSAVLELCTGIWGSSGEGAFARVQKINEYGWIGAFSGATNHLLREVRLLESSGAESAYSGIWLKLMGDRTYKISGAAGPPIEYATYVPTIGTPLIVVTPPGMGTQTRIKSNFYFASNGEEIDPVIRSPNGSRWRINVSNAGAVSTTAL